MTYLDRLNALRHRASMHALEAPAGSAQRKHREQRLHKIRAALNAAA